VFLFLLSSYIVGLENEIFPQTTSMICNCQVVLLREIKFLFVNVVPVKKTQIYIILDFQCCKHIFALKTFKFFLGNNYSQYFFVNRFNQVLEL
jgi:hypothetical protein